MSKTKASMPANIQETIIYNCSVILGDETSAKHMVPKTDITEQELRLLGHIHGKDHITNIEKGDAARIDVDELMHELAMAYSVKVVEDFFKISLDDHEAWAANRFDRIEEERMERERKAQRAQKYAPKAAKAPVAPPAGGNEEEEEQEQTGGAGAQVLTT